MKINEIITESLRTENPCWKGYHPVGTKKKNGKTVPNCVPEKIKEDATRLNVGDPVIVTGNVQFNGATGEIDSFGSNNSFVVVNLYNHGKHSFHSSDVSYNEYADSDDEEARMYDRGEFRNEIDETAAWQRKEGKSKSGGLNAKGVASYRRENPGSKLQTAVTTKPSKLKPGSKDAKRRKSFCARMGGMPGPMKDENGKPTRKALSLKKWNC